MKNIVCSEIRILFRPNTTCKSLSRLRSYLFTLGSKIVDCVNHDALRAFVYVCNPASESASIVDGDTSIYSMSNSNTYMALSVYDSEDSLNVYGSLVHRVESLESRTCSSKIFKLS